MNPYNNEMLHRRRAVVWVIGGLIVLVAAIIAVAGLARLYWYPSVMAYNGAYGGWFFFPFFFPFGFLFFFFVIFALGRLFFWPWGWGGRRGYWYQYSGAEEILRERYAKGEITKEQLDQMMRDLWQHR
ncbi:MAG: SHOCT domain-containing protein [Thaumarchaeota archaeon]|nr:SHOCT domain-containing protein [Nitrososphaerota archaeon]